MRIISDFHDYYDSAQSLGQDQSVIYQRKLVEYKTGESDVPDVIKTLWEATKVESGLWYYTGIRWTQSLWSKTHSYQLHRSRLVFCGKVYPLIEVVKELRGGVGARSQTVWYSADSLVEFLTKGGVSDLDKKTSRWDKKNEINKIEEFFAKETKLEYEWCVENKVIIALINGKAVTINPVLTQLEFFRVFDVYSAYQELDMWVSGTLSFPQNAMIELDDKYRVIAHGFDHKYAFRKEPTKRK